MILKKVTKYEGLLGRCGVYHVPYKTTYYFLGAPIYKRVVTFDDDYLSMESPRKVKCYLFGVCLFTLIVRDDVSQI